MSEPLPEIYLDKLIDAEAALAQVNPGLAHRLKQVVCDAITAIKDTASVGGLSIEDAWDQLSFQDGANAALEYARKEGITDEDVLRLVAHMGIALAALKIRIGMDSVRDASAVQLDKSTPIPFP